MNRRIASILPALLACAGLQAATINTSMTVNTTLAISGTSFAATGTAALTNIGSGTFSATISLSSIGASGNVTAPYTITLSSGDKIQGNLLIPPQLLSGATSGAGSATVTGGTGAYAGATGSFPNLSGSSTGSIATTLSITFSGAGTVTTTGGGGPSNPTPIISAVQDAAGNTANIAQGSIFIVKGSTLSASGFTSYAPPRPTQPSGVKVTFTPVAGGTGTDAYIVYLFNQNGVNQIAGILPSTVATGDYNVTVTNSGTVSNTFATKVVASKLALFTQDSTGTGLGSIQNYVSASQVDLNRLTTVSVSGVTISPAHPGQAVIAYGTGLGAYAAGDNTASPAVDFSGSLTIRAIVGGISIPVAYAGRAGYAGEDQINFILPPNVQTGCAVPLQLSVNGVVSPTVSMSIAPDANSNACTMPGYTLSQLQGLDQGNSIVTGGFSIAQFGITVPQVGAIKSDVIGGSFIQVTAFQLASAAQVNISVIQQGSCQILQATTTGGVSTGGSVNYLDAGNLTVTGPSGSGLSSQALTKTNNSYSLLTSEGFSIPGQVNFSLPAGTYTLNGGGGPDVGSFNASLTLASPLTVTGNLPTTVQRSSPLTLNWTGGNPSDLVEIIGSSSSSTGTGASATTTTTSFYCLTTAGQHTFTVPSSILSQLPASTASVPGILEIASGNAGSTFTASLPKLGGSVTGAFASFVGTGAQVTWQ